MDELAPGEEGLEPGSPAVEGIDGEDPGISPGIDGEEEPGMPPGMDGAPEAPLEPELDELDELEEELDELEEEELELLLDLHPTKSATAAANKQQRIKPCDLVMVIILFSSFFRLVFIAIAVA